MAENRVAFVTHGGAAIGFGHVKRCVALARAFAGAGAQCLFLVSPDPDVGAVYSYVADELLIACIHVLEFVHD